MDIGPMKHRLRLRYFRGPQTFVKPRFDFPSNPRNQRHSENPLELIDRLDGVNACWLWQGYCGGGYGLFKGRGAHRVIWELLREPIMEGMVLDHLCRNLRCVNPAHLRPITKELNSHRASFYP